MKITGQKHIDCIVGLLSALGVMFLLEVVAYVVYGDDLVVYFGERVKRVLHL